jgi:hypothetical protein
MRDKADGSCYLFGLKRVTQKVARFLIIKDNIFTKKEHMQIKG